MMVLVSLAWRACIGVPGVIVDDSGACLVAALRIRTDFLRRVGHVGIFRAELIFVDADLDNHLVLNAHGTPSPLLAAPQIAYFKIGIQFYHQSLAGKWRVRDGL